MLIYNFCSSARLEWERAAVTMVVGPAAVEVALVAVMVVAIVIVMAEAELPSFGANLAIFSISIAIELRRFMTEPTEFRRESGNLFNLAVYRRV